ncbi:MAG TPA: hypothetical protein VKT82_01920 [Ktedonobacterales bacterium]|nr:hypothetical protein [Ktedonobacterales bacterium]
MPRRSASKSKNTAPRSTGRRVLGFLLGLINPLHDPSLTVALILTFIEEIGSPDPVWRVVLMLVLNWVAVKAVVWVVVNFAFAAAFLVRKGWWALHNPKLAWRVLDALGTEDIIVGPIRELLGQEGSMALSENGVMGALPALGGLTGGMPMLGRPPMYEDPPPSYESQYQDQQSAEELNHIRDILATYARLVADWSAATDEKWRTISDSQLGWKPLRGRWGSWDEIYSENFSTRTSDPIASQAAQASIEATSRRFENARDRGSAASAVVCFLRDLDTLRQSLLMLDLPEDVQQVNNLASSGVYPMNGRGNTAARVPLIRRPAQMYVDAE